MYRMTVAYRRYMDISLSFNGVNKNSRKCNAVRTLHYDCNLVVRYSQLCSAVGLRLVDRNVEQQIQHL